MKKTFWIALLLFVIPAVSFAEVFSSQSIGGTTGLISTPTAQIAGDGKDLSVDAGIHYIKDGGSSSSTPEAILSFQNRFEVGVTEDIQRPGNDNNDLLIHAKFRFSPWDGSGKSDFAVGGNYQNIYAPSGRETFWQGYLAATYTGELFSMPAETTFVLGKTIGTHYDNSNIDFSMGLDLVLWPSVFRGYLHWISDFANYSYSASPCGVNAYDRGCFNTGARIAVLKDQKKLKLNIDLLYLDVLDSNRCFGVGVSFGMAF